MYSEQKSNNFTNGLVLSNVYCPSEVIANFLIFVNWKDLLSCRLVCKSWYRLIDSIVASEKLKRLHKESLKLSFTRSITTLSNVPFYLCYAIGKKAFGKNHLKNAFGSGEVDHVCQRSWRFPRSRYLEMCSNSDCPKFKHWQVTESGGDGWIVETIPVGSQSLPEHLEGRSCFVTSYQRARKEQLVALIECGLNAKIMDCIQPHIEVSEWYARRFDCGIRYSLKSSLLNEQKEVVKEAVYNIEDRDGDDNWHQIFHTFEDYGVGVRYVFFEHEGWDTQFWAGHYGAKMAGGSVVARIPTEHFE